MKRYVVLLDGRPFQGVLLESSIPYVKAEVAAKYGDTALERVTVEVVTTEPYEPSGACSVEQDSL